MLIQETEVKTLGEYIDFLEKEDGHELILFRGQPKDESLLPKFARNHPKLRKVRSILLERRILADFKKRARPYLDFEVRSDWEWLALAQHHGLITRLLDWTKNPLAALWFTVKDACANEDEYGVVWRFIVQEKNLLDEKENPDPFDNSEVKVYQPEHIVKRLVAQDGWFTVHKARIAPLELEENLSDKLLKIKIPSKSFSRIRYHLDQCNINHASLFPDLDGLCEHMVWLETCMKDEEEMLGAY